MEMATKNIGVGELITDLRELKTLAEEKKSVAVRGAWGLYVRPAAWMYQWSLAMLMTQRIYKTIKVK